MTVTPIRTLPLISAPHAGGRDPMTCKYRCDDACAKPVPNESNSSYFGDIVARSISRRSVLAGGAATAAIVGLGALNPSSAAAAPRGGRPAPAAPRSLADFVSIAAVPAGTDRLEVPNGFAWKPLAVWGDPILKGAPKFDFDHQTPAAQAGQIGYNNDFTTIVRSRNRRDGWLVFNNEYTNDELMFRGFGGFASATDDQLKIAMNAHGMTVVKIERNRRGVPWSTDQRNRDNRRITASTPMDFTGPAAGHTLLRTSADRSGRRVLGTFGNCAGGVTPWGTVLSGEENFNGYFAAPTAPAGQEAAYKRYGLTGSRGRGWERVDRRFDAVQEPNEPNRFGWVVEVDPSDPKAAPRKLTALGRFKHEGATTTLARDGRVVVYMGDDERFDYTYKFVSKGRYDRRMPTRKARELLSEGDLFVARFTGDGDADGVHDGTGEWLPLVQDGKSKVPGMTVAEVLIWTRLAADKVNPTKMDRPEDVETNPVTGATYIVCTNNSSRTPSQVDEANPRANNKHGHIVELNPAHGDHGSTQFVWDLVLIAGDPNDPQTYFAGFDKSKVSSISCPDNVAFDRAGNLWIATDGNSLGNCDGLYMMPLQGPERGHLKQFLSVPAGAETCGPVIDDESGAVLVAVQHPGELSGASPDSPKSAFPYVGGNQPRPAIVQVYRP